MLEIDLLRHVKVDGKPALYGCTDIAPLAAENDRLLKQLMIRQNSLKKYHGVICSPLLRCQSIASRFAQTYQLPLEIFDGLQEMNFGLFDGVPFDDIPFGKEAFDKEAFEKLANDENHLGCVNNQGLKVHWSLLESFFQTPASIALPNGERLVNFHHRVIAAWQKLIEQQIAIESKKASQQCEFVTRQKKQAKQKSRRILVVAHGGVIRMIIAHILQLDWQQASWHQQLNIGYGSLSRICLSQPYQNEQILQQITTIAMPFLEEA